MSILSILAHKFAHKVKALLAGGDLIVRLLAFVAQYTAYPALTR
jgi:hypothetical protein